MLKHRLCELTLHKNNLQEIEIIINEFIRQKSQVDFRFCTSRYVVHYEDIKKIEFIKWNDGIKIKLIKLPHELKLVDSHFESIYVMKDDFVFNIGTSFSSTLNKLEKMVCKTYISFHEFKDIK